MINAKAEALSGIYQELALNDWGGVRVYRIAVCHVFLTYLSCAVGIAVSSLAFGFSTTFYLAVCFRFLIGFLNGNMNTCFLPITSATRPHMKLRCIQFHNVTNTIHTHVFFYYISSIY